MALSEAEMRRRAVAKALVRRDAAGFRRVCLGTYKVESDSQPGTWHTVKVEADGRHRCDCPAGLAHRPCWHAALTYVIRLEKNSGVRVKAPAPAAAPVTLAIPSRSRTPRREVALLDAAA
jgi:hypothetical protein